MKEYAEVVNVGLQRELFVDEHLTDEINGLRFELHHPVPREISFVVDADDASSNVSCYASILQDASGNCRMYYRAGCWAASLHRKSRPGARWFLCAAESKDGKHWNRPKLDILPEARNAVLNYDMSTAKLCRERVAGATSVMYDTNPDCPPEERYKLLGAAEGVQNHGLHHKLFLYTSPDGFHFRHFRNITEPLPIMTSADSQNTLIWDVLHQCYRIYHRVYDGPDLKHRAIYTCTSADLLNWSDSEPVQFHDEYSQMALYTNNIAPYFRAPQYYMGFPMRYCDNDEKWDMSLFTRPGFEERSYREQFSRRGATTSTDTVFIVSRDAVNFKRYPCAFIRPGAEQTNSWAYGDAAAAYGIMQTASDLGNGAPDELSWLVTSGYRQSDPTAFRRYTLRLDGFVSLHADGTPGQVLTRPFIYDGGNLRINAATSAWGHVAAELTDLSGKPLPGYSLQECWRGAMDDVDLVIRWQKNGGDCRKLSGKPVRLRLEVLDGDLYAWRFAPYETDPVLTGGQGAVGLRD